MAADLDALNNLKANGPMNAPVAEREEQIHAEKRMDCGGATITWAWEQGEWRLCLWGIHPANPPKSPFIDDVFIAQCGALGRLRWSFDGENWCLCTVASGLDYD